MVVVGAGVHGAVVAHHLVRRGSGRVVLLDDGRPSAATGNSVGVLSRSYLDDEEAALAEAGVRELRAFAAATGRDVGDRPVGVVRLLSPSHLDDARRRAAALSASGVPVELLTPQGASDLLAGLSGEQLGGVLHEPDGGHADPSRTAAAYVAEARAGGAEVRRDAVRRVVVRSGAVAGVETTDGVLATRHVVIAAGAWSTGLLAPLGIDLGLTPRRVQVAAFPLAGAPQWDRVVLDMVSGLWLRPDARRLLAGLEMSEPVTDADLPLAGVDPWYSELCRRRLQGRVEGASAAAPDHGWSGLISMSADGLPVVDELVECTGLWCLVGDSGSSFKTAALTGRRLAERITSGGPATADVAALARRRSSGTGLRAHGGRYNRLAVSLRLGREARLVERQFAEQAPQGRGPGSTSVAPR